jgi:hypothetical protein
MVLSIPLHGGYITLNTVLSCEVTPPSVKTTLTIENKGNEAAFNLQARFKISEKEWLSKIYPKLEANQKIEIESIQDFVPEKIGNYPLTAKVFFQDAAGYSFTSVLVSLLTYNEVTRPSLLGTIEDVAISDRGDLKLQVTNLAYDDLDMDIRVLTPDELSIEPREKEMTLQARGKQDFEFALSNLSALVGATYPVWVVMEYENEDKHFTYLCSGSISIEPKINIFETYWWAFLILAVVLIGVFIGLNLKKRFTVQNQ